jgi:RNA polymerase sigma factor (sigma-70 family)
VATVVESDFTKLKIFSTTRWALIKRCSEADEAKARVALEELCQSYWYPVYACIRHQGHGVPDAEDITQDFFAEMLTRRWIKYLDEAKGRFRSYLSTALRHFLQDRLKRRLALKRGGRRTIISLDAGLAEKWEALEPVTHITPESLYEIKWARLVISHALEQFRLELSGQNKAHMFHHFNALLISGRGESDYEAVAEALGMSKGALHVAMHRMRRRFGALLREEIARTVFSPEEVDEELSYLCKIFATCSS